MPILEAPYEPGLRDGRKMVIRRATFDVPVMLETLKPVIDIPRTSTTWWPPEPIPKYWAGIGGA